MFYVARYAFDGATRRYRLKDRIGLASYRAAVHEAEVEREHCRRMDLPLMVRVEIRTASGAYIDAPDPVRDAAYADRAALGRLTGSGGL